MEKAELKKMGETIQAMREQRGLSKEELAQAADILPNRLLQIENGEKSPSAYTLYLICEKLGLPMESLLTIQSDEDRQAEGFDPRRVVDEETLTIAIEQIRNYLDK